MIKREELTNPASCMSRAHDDEMTFVLLARDVAAPAVIRQWAKERIRLGKNSVADAQIQEAFACASAMEKYRAPAPSEAARPPVPGPPVPGPPVPRIHHRTQWRTGMKPTIETATVYRLRGFKPESFAWADITIRSWKNGGSIDVQSDYGSYAYQWGATGTDDIRAFLVRLDYGYFMGKAHTSHGYETDWEATAEAIKRRVLQARRDGDIKADKARECFEALGDLDKDAGLFWQAREYPALHDFLYREDHETVTVRHGQCNGFWTVIWPEICAIWKEEMISVPVAAPNGGK